MKSQTYMDRALRASDPRYARVLEKLGYGRRDMVAATEPKRTLPKPDEITMLRAEYERVVGKKAFNGWKSDKLRENIAAAKG